MPEAFNRMTIVSLLIFLIAISSTKAELGNCPMGKYFNSILSQCLPCDLPCLSCAGASTYCTVCTGDLYPSIGHCMGCPEGCSQCTGKKPEECVQCRSGHTMDAALGCVRIRKDGDILDIPAFVFWALIGLAVTFFLFCSVLCWLKASTEQKANRSLSSDDVSTKRVLFANSSKKGASHVDNASVTERTLQPSTQTRPLPRPEENQALDSEDRALGPRTSRPTLN